jgi:hypothetical protein
MNSNTKSLRERRAKAYAEAVEYLKNGLTTESNRSYNKAMDEVESLGREILAAENGGFAPQPARNPAKPARKPISLSISTCALANSPWTPRKEKHWLLAQKSAIRRPVRKRFRNRPAALADIWFRLAFPTKSKLQRNGTRL